MPIFYNAFCLTLSQTSPGFYMSAVKVFRKHWLKEKLLLISKFSFPTVYTLPVWKTPCHFRQIKIVECKFFQYGGV